MAEEETADRSARPSTRLPSAPLGASGASRILCLLCTLCVCAVARTFDCAGNVVEHSSTIEWDKLSKPVWKLASGFCSGRPALRDGHLLDSKVPPSRLRAEAWLRGALQQRQALRRA